MAALRLTCFVYIGAACSIASAQLLSFDVNESKSIQQGRWEDGYCGPACVLNAMQFGSPAFRDAFVQLQNEIEDQSPLESVVNRARKWQSTINGKAEFFNSKTGFTMCYEDMPFFFHQIIRSKDAAGINGQIVNQHVDESSRSHLERIHALITQSFSAGLPPVASFTLYAAYSKPAESSMKWHPEITHSVCIVGVEEKLLPQSSGFNVVVLDPHDGRMKHGYLFVEKNRTFGAYLGSANDAEWIKGMPFLNLVCPDMNLLEGETSWSQRTTVLMVYLTGVFEQSSPPPIQLNLGFLKVELKRSAIKSNPTQEQHSSKDSRKLEHPSKQ